MTKTFVAFLQNKGCFDLGLIIRQEVRVLYELCSQPLSSDTDNLKSEATNVFFIEVKNAAGVGQ